MFSYNDVEKSRLFKPISLINTVSCVRFSNNFLLAGIGNILLVYDTESHKLCVRRKIFDKSSIHGIQFNDKQMLMAVHGEKYVAIYKVMKQMKQTGFLIEFDCILTTTDWVCNIQWMDSNCLLTVSAHNVATVWSLDLKKKINSSSCDERCILYSATSTGGDEENIIVFSGTVFKEIVIWSPFRRSNGLNILHRLQLHEGVIFSITVNKSNSIISSTSDDRSIVIWNVEPFAKHQNTYDHWKLAKITPAYSFYAHKARVWKSILMQSGNILSAGEDGQICLKTSSRIYQWEETRGSQVRSLDCMEIKNLAASGCTTGSIGLWSLDTVPKNEILADYKKDNCYPKHLVVLSNAKTYVLYSNGYVVSYKNNTSNNVYQNDVLCCTLTMVKSPCETKITFTTSSGHIVILKSTSIQVFFDKISTVKIVSTIWLNNNQIIVCCIGNTFVRYEVFDDLKINYLDTYCIFSKTNSWITTAVLVEGFIFAGCNEGSIYLFKLNLQKPLKVFSKIHSFAGVTAMWIHEKYSNFTVVSSVGRDGHHRYWNICTQSESVFEIRCDILPTKWPFIITNSKVHGLLICGFKESNLIVYSSIEQRIIATVSCGGGHRAWDLSFINDCDSIYFVCSSSSNTLEINKIPLHGQHMLLKGFHSMIVNCMTQITDDLMVTGSDDTTVRLTRFNDEVDNLLTLRSHISSVRSVSCISLKPNVYIIVTAGGRAQLKIWTLNIIDNSVYCEESISHLLKTKQEKKPWRSVVPSNEGETRFMDVCVQYTKSKSILISVGCSDAILRLYNYDTNNKTLSLIEDNLDCNSCILKILHVQLNIFHYILTTDTKGFVNFWDISKYIDESDIELTFIPKYRHCLHQSGINCCDWLKIENNYGLLTTGGDDQRLSLSIFHYEDTVTLLCNVSICIHCSQVTGVKVYNQFVITTSVDQKIIFSSWSCDLNSKTIRVSPLASYFTTVADIHGLIAHKYEDEVKVIVYGQGVETFYADMSSLTQSSSPPIQVDQKFNVERVSPALELGEGPHWDSLTRSLYFVDLHQSQINRYHPESNSFFSAKIEGYNDVTFIVPIEDEINTFVVGLGPSIGIVQWDGRSNTTSQPEYMKLIDETPGNRLNDGKADATGRLWVGSMGSEIADNPGHYHKHRGSLFSIESDGTINKRLSNVSISNGLAWSSDNKEFYYVDTYKFAVEAYDFDIVTGDLTNGRVIFDLKANKVTGDPDGMTIDKNGNLWVACFNSDHILKIDPTTGVLLTTVQFPAYQITSAAFGGPKLDELYVTTAGYQLTEAQKTKRPYSGALFRVTNTGSTGFEGVSAKIHICPKNQLNTI
ncbi:WD repeat-containing protein 6-like isoform X2 [Melanaphis sacchari]|nr:WD repeat-containing protein 6-like isoform X2 [Melanaphis sacchari]